VWIIDGGVIAELGIDEGRILHGGRWVMMYGLAVENENGVIEMCRGGVEEVMTYSEECAVGASSLSAEVALSFESSCSRRFLLFVKPQCFPVVKTDHHLVA
jgi:hypothetical protein